MCNAFWNCLFLGGLNKSYLTFTSHTSGQKVHFLLTTLWIYGNLKFEGHLPSVLLYKVYKSSVAEGPQMVFNRFSCIWAKCLENDMHHCRPKTTLHQHVVYRYLVIIFLRISTEAWQKRKCSCTQRQHVLISQIYAKSMHSQILYFQKWTISILSFFVRNGEKEEK